jgi:hypothetical protein
MRSDAPDNAAEAQGEAMSDYEKCIEQNRRLVENNDKLAALVDAACDKGEKLEARLRIFDALNQHVNYLLFGYLGVLAGIVLALTMTVWGHPLRGLALFCMGFLLSLILAAFAQDRWNRKVNP